MLPKLLAIDQVHRAESHKILKTFDSILLYLAESQVLHFIVIERADLHDKMEADFKNLTWSKELLKFCSNYQGTICGSKMADALMKFVH